MHITTDLHQRNDMNFRAAISSPFGICQSQANACTSELQ